MNENPTASAGETWMMIVNPNAGVKKGTRDWPKILAQLRRERVQFEYRLTTCKGDAIRIALESLAAGFRKLAVTGGDGTMNEVLNGIMQQQAVPLSEILIGMIPVGTGNDWCRMYGIPFDYRKAIQVIKRENVFIQDIGRVIYHQGERQEERYFLNVAGMGYDAMVANKTNILKEKGMGGPLTYMYFVFASLLQFRFPDAIIEVDGATVYKGEIFSMNVGICKYNGGGMMQVPNAVSDDGLLDVTVIKKASKWAVVRHIRRLYDGSLASLPMVATFQGRVIRIRSTGKIFLETDGESMGHSPLTFTILHRGLHIVTGK